MMLLLTLSAVVATSVEALSIQTGQALRAQGPLDSCGARPSYDNAKPKNHEDAMATKFNKVTKKREAVVFKKGDNIVYKCLPGFSTDGSKDGTQEFTAACGATGFFKPGGVCLKASKCGAVPVIPNAAATAKKVAGAVQFGCNPGYSLDGEKVVAGGFGKNVLFTLKCVEFSGAYEKFAGACQNYAFVASKESTRIYGEVFEALFVVTCKGKLTTAFGKGKAAPVDASCGKLKAASTKGACAALVNDIKKDFDAKKKALATYSAKKEWFDTKGKPGVDKDSDDFCKGLYKLVEAPNDF